VRCSRAAETGEKEETGHRRTFREGTEEAEGEKEGNVGRVKIVRSEAVALVLGEKAVKSRSSPKAEVRMSVSIGTKRLVDPLWWKSAEVFFRGRILLPGRRGLDVNSLKTGQKTHPARPPLQNMKGKEQMPPVHVTQLVDGVPLSHHRSLVLDRVRLQP